MIGCQSEIHDYPAMKAMRKHCSRWCHYATLGNSVVGLPSLNSLNQLLTVQPQKGVDRETDRK